MRGHSCGPTEPGSALGPDWNEGIALRGAEQVKYCVHLCYLRHRGQLKESVCLCGKYLLQINLYVLTLCLLNVFSLLLCNQVSRRVTVEYQCEVEKILTSEELLNAKERTLRPEHGEN